MSRVVALFVSVPLALSFACGPRLESMHASNVRFEHCYRLDMDPRIAPSHRMMCWKDWTEAYAIGQSRDRVEYARRRIITLESGDAELLSIETQPQRKRVFEVIGETPARDAPMAAPAPTSAHAPPPRTAPEAASAGVEPTAPPTPPLPGAKCSDPCRQAYTECQRRCEKDSDACTACREEFRGCMRACFE